LNFEDKENIGFLVKTDGLHGLSQTKKKYIWLNQALKEGSSAKVESKGHIPLDGSSFPPASSPTSNGDLG
jgi:hypothetical protein